jgi:hypothetical protein
MPRRYEIELEPEVRAWLDSLPLAQYAKAEAMAGREIYERKWD